MSAAQLTSNKAAFSRIHEAVNSGDAEVISKTIDEVVEPNALFHTPAPIDATGAQALKQVWAVLLRAFPDIHVAVEDVIAEGGQGGLQEHGYRDPPGRIQGPPTNRQIDHVQRDFHRPLCGRPDR
jgi:SnoaL-like polyketide cyclase